MAPLSAVIPGTGYHVRWHVLFMELARGVPASQLMRKTGAEVEPVLELFEQRLNKTLVGGGALVCGQALSRSLWCRV